MSRLFRLVRDDRGGTAIEYSLIGALIAVAAIVAMQGLGDQVNTTFGNVTETMDAAS
jgi:pilus assembly protein Flp/PilA